MESEKWETKVVVIGGAVFGALVVQFILETMVGHSSRSGESSYIEISGFTEVVLIVAGAVLAAVICGIVSQRHNSHIQ